MRWSHQSATSLFWRLPRMTAFALTFAVSRKLRSGLPSWCLRLKKLTEVSNLFMIITVSSQYSSVCPSDYFSIWIKILLIAFLHFEATTLDFWTNTLPKALRFRCSQLFHRAFSCSSFHFYLFLWILLFYGCFYFWWLSGALWSDTIILKCINT